jgi:hypothetical protein
MTQFSDPPPSGGVDPVPYPVGTAPLDTEGRAGLGAARHEEPSTTTDVAKDQAAEVTNTAVDAGKHVANVAGEQAGQVASEATHQVKELVAQTRSELTEQAATQQQRVARGLRALGTELEAMARGSQNPGMATDLVAQVSERTNTVAAWLEHREPGHVVDEVTRFARQRPGAFLALAAGAGLLVGRLGRGLKAAHDGEEGAQDTSPRSLAERPQAQVGDISGAGYAPTPPPPVPTYPPPPSGYEPSGYQQPPGTASQPPPLPGHPQPQAPEYFPPPSYPPQTPGSPQGASRRDLPR